MSSHCSRIGALCSFVQPGPLFAILAIILIDNNIITLTT